MIFQITDLSHFYKKVRALDSVSFSVRKGESFALLGPNGSGKSTLIKILSKLLRPQFGSVVYSGQEFSLEKKPSRRQILWLRKQTGVVFQTPALDKKLTVMENMVHHGHLYGLSGKGLRERILEVASHLSLKDSLGCFVEKLSGGTQRRVELAKVLIPSPSVLILDEPTSGLDPQARALFWMFVGRLKMIQSLTILYSTHHFDEVETLADRVLMLSEGHVVAEGAPNNLTQELGKDLLCAEVRDSDEVGRILKHDFGLETIVRAGRIYADVSRKRDCINEVYRAISEKSCRLTVGHPDLSDVFFIRTGHDKGAAVWNSTP